MSATDGRWVAEKGFTDLQIFYGPQSMIDTAGLATGPTNPSLGVYLKTVPSTDASKFVIDLSGLWLRAGMLANAGDDQEQFGTATQSAPTLVVPGPSSVS